jgi:hypothetical protein
MIMEIEFRIQKYSHIFNKVSICYRRLTKLLLVDRSPNFGFNNAEFHIVNSTPSLCTMNDNDNNNNSFLYYLCASQQLQGQL